MISSYWPTLLIAAKLTAAIVCGGAIGFERELSHKAAGLRTNVLICFGAALYMIVSRHISGGAPYTDPARLAAQVVAGVGFLGAGVILQARGSIKGLTTAATMFVVGAVGVALGEGMFVLAFFSTILIILVLVALLKLENAFVRRTRLFHYRLTTAEPAESLERLMDLLDRERIRLEEFEVKELNRDEHEIKFSVITSLKGNTRLVEHLRGLGNGLRTASHN